MSVLFYQIKLPLPTSVNASKTVGKGYRCKKTGKWKRTVSRSGEYNDWIQSAAVVYRNKFQGGVQMFKGRIRVDYCFIWNIKDLGKDKSDIGNREKCLSDFLEHKFYKNDNQIDEQHQYRRISETLETCAYIRVYEIPDRRYDDPLLIFPT